MKSILKKPFLAALLVAFPPLAAHAASPIAPDAGSMLRQVQPTTAPAPSSSDAVLTIKREDEASTGSFLVQAIQITGNTRFDTATLQALVKAAEGKYFTPTQLTELAGRITRYYNSNGYPLARAIIPAQTISSGVVRIEVIEAGNDKISPDNRSRTSDPLLAEPVVLVTRASQGAQSPAPSFLVKNIQITGNKKIDTATLHALVADAEGKSLTITELDKVISRITSYYGSHGYPRARATIPTQTIRSGVVKVQIILVGGDSRKRKSVPLKATLAPSPVAAVIPQPVQPTVAAVPPEVANSPFLVKRIRIAGNKKIDTATLHALVADAEGETMTLVQLNKVISRITDYYNSHDYPLARAIIPEQTIQSGIVQIQVIEARYDQISLDNRSRVIDPLLKATLAPLKNGQEVDQSSLDRALLLLSDIPGVVTAATLKPGASAGTSDLLVSTTPGPLVTGDVAVDNYGNRFTGRPRIGGTVNVNNPLLHGDVLSLSGLSAGEGLNYGRLSYESLLNGLGTRVGGSYSALYYELNGTLSSLNANGTAQVGSVWLKQPLVRSRDTNLYGQIQYDRLQLRDHVDATGIRNDRSLDNVTLSLSGDRRDTFLTGAVSSMSLSWTPGRVGFDNSDAQSADAATAKTRGSFSKLNLNLARLQNLGSHNGLYLAVSGQWANGNLDSSQKMIVGGPYTVRAYDIGALSGDTAYFASAEFRRQLGRALAGQWQAVGFIDSAHVTINENAFAPGKNSATLSGAGVGLNWAGLNQWSARATISTPVGGTPELLGATQSERAWVEISKRFY